LKKASWSCNLCFEKKIIEFDFPQNINKPCDYTKLSESGVVVLTMYVDEIPLIGNNIHIL